MSDQHFVSVTEFYFYFFFSMQIKRKFEWKWIAVQCDRARAHVWRVWIKRHSTKTEERKFSAERNIKRKRWQYQFRFQLWEKWRLESFFFLWVKDFLKMRNSLLNIFLIVSCLFFLLNSLNIFQQLHFSLFTVLSIIDLKVKFWLNLKDFLSNFNFTVTMILKIFWTYRAWNFNMVHWPSNQGYP